MSPITEGILAGVIANALTSILSQIAPHERQKKSPVLSQVSLVEQDRSLAEDTRQVVDSWGLGDAGAVEASLFPVLIPLPRWPIVFSGHQAL